mgnify:FL=1
MAVHAKRILPQGSGNFITADGNVTATDLQYTSPDGDVYQATMSKIERIVNFTGGAITVNGVSFAAGTWDFSISGGYDLDANLTAINISGGLVTLRQ